MSIDSLLSSQGNLNRVDQLARDAILTVNSDVQRAQTDLAALDASILALTTNLSATDATIAALDTRLTGASGQNASDLAALTVRVVALETFQNAQAGELRLIAPSQITVEEGSTFVLAPGVLGAQGTIIYTFLSNPGDLFELVSGVVRFRAPAVYRQNQQNDYSISLLATDQVSGLTDVASFIVTVADIDVNLSAFSAGVQNGTTLPLTITSDRSAQLSVVVTSGTETLTPAQAEAGLDQNNQAAPVAQTFTLAAGVNSLTLNLPQLSGSYTVHAYALGSDVNPLKTAPVTLNTVAPAIVRFDPVDGDDTVPLSQVFDLVVNQAIGAVGTVTIREVGGGALETFSLATGNSDQGGTVAVIDLGGGEWAIRLTPGTSFALGQSIAFVWAGIQNTVAIPLADNQTDTLWNVQFAAVADTLDTDLLAIFAANLGHSPDALFGGL